MNVIEPILRHARTQPEAQALVEGDRTITYRELRALVLRLAGHLLALGIARGDRIGICLKDSCEHVVVLLALARIGAVSVPLDWRARAPENAGVVGGLELKVVLAEVGARLLPDKRVIALDESFYRAADRAVFAPAASTDWHDPFVISASSGSTGVPKFVLTTHLQFHFTLAARFELMGLTGRHRYLATFALYYAAGRNSCIAHLMRGDTVILYPSVFSAGEYVAIARRERASVGSVTPAVVRKLFTLTTAGLLLPGMAAFFCTGAPLQAEEKRVAALRLTPHFCERYGTAETQDISMLRPADFSDRADSVGQPHSLADIEIVDEEDRPLPDGEIGQLRYRGPGLASPIGAAAEANFRDGWFYPGEIARLDKRGFIFLQGRASEVIMRRGAKVYPAEVEMVLGEHPAVADVAVVGHRPALGDEDDVAAFVVVRHEVRPGQLLAHCRARLTPHKVPRQILLLPELPKNTSGKIDKRALAQRLTGADLNQGSPIIAR